MQQVSVKEIASYLLYSRKEEKKDCRSYEERNQDIMHRINCLIGEADLKVDDEISSLLAELSELHFEAGIRAGFQLAADALKGDV